MAGDGFVYLHVSVALSSDGRRSREGVMKGVLNAIGGVVLANTTATCAHRVVTSCSFTTQIQGNSQDALGVASSTLRSLHTEGLACNPTRWGISVTPTLAVLAAEALQIGGVRRHQVQSLSIDDDAVVVDELRGRSKPSHLVVRREMPTEDTARNVLRQCGAVNAGTLSDPLASLLLLCKNDDFEADINGAISVGLQHIHGEALLTHLRELSLQVALKLHIHKQIPETVILQVNTVWRKLAYTGGTTRASLIYHTVARLWGVMEEYVGGVSAVGVRCAAKGVADVAEAVATEALPPAAGLAEVRTQVADGTHTAETVVGFLCRAIEMRNEHGAQRLLKTIERLDVSLHAQLHPLCALPPKQAIHALQGWLSLVTSNTLVL